MLLPLIIKLTTYTPVPKLSFWNDLKRLVPPSFTFKLLNNLPFMSCTCKMASSIPVSTLKDTATIFLDGFGAVFKILVIFN